MKRTEQFLKILKEIVEQVEEECTLINAGKDSKWDKEQLENIVLPEINELLTYALRGKVFFKYGRNQRFLESTYLITDSLKKLNDTSLGKKILELQQIYNSL